MTRSVIDHESGAAAAIHGEASETGKAGAEGAPNSWRGDLGPRPEVTQLTVTAEDRRVAWLATAAVGLSLVDAAIPSPLPGVKPGLANIVTLVVLARYGWGTAVWVSALRVLAGSLLLGFFLAPGFFLSLTGTTLSLLTLGLARHLPKRWFGPVSLSILAAFAHIGGQLLLARAWLIPHDGVFLLTPVFAAAALVFGTINGLIAAKLLAEPAPSETPNV